MSQPFNCDKALKAPQPSQVLTGKEHPREVDNAHPELELDIVAVSHLF